MALEETLRRIEKKLEKIEGEINEMRLQMRNNMIGDERKLSKLPDHLRKTVNGLKKVGQGTASDVCKYTTRARAVESNYLNQLEREGFIKSFRKGRRKIFMFEENLRKPS
jgi:regulator of replication initiation timing